MTTSIRNATLTGHLGQEPELLVSQAGKPYCKVSFAMNKWDTRKLAEMTIWAEVFLFGTSAELFTGKAHKGDLVAVTGEIWARAYIDKHGEAKLTMEVDFGRVVVLAQNLPHGKQPDDEEEMKQLLAEVEDRPF